MAAPIEELRGAVTGDVLEPFDREYEQARLSFNLLIDRRPAAITRCVDADDVATALAFAQSNDLEIAVRGGGHNPAGHCAVDDGLVIDLSRMRNVEVDPERGVATLRGRRDLARLRRRHPAARPGHARRRGRFDRRHRTHPRRRHRPPHRPARSHLRQPDRRRGGHSGRRGRPCGRGGRSGAALGAAWGRGQLRRRDAGRVPAPSSWSALSAADFDYEGDCGARRAPRLPRRRWLRPATSSASSARSHRSEDHDADARGRSPAGRARGARPRSSRLCARRRGSSTTRSASRASSTSRRIFDPATASTATTGRATSSASCPDELIDVLVDSLTALGRPPGAILIESLRGAPKDVDPDSAALGYRDAAFNVSVMANWTDPALDDESHRLGPRDRRRDRALVSQRRLRQLHAGRRAPRSRPRRLRPRELRAPPGPQVPLRPGQRPAQEPKHPALALNGVRWSESWIFPIRLDS